MIYYILLARVNLASVLVKSLALVCTEIKKKKKKLNILNKLNRKILRYIENLPYGCFCQHFKNIEVAIVNNSAV